jgi:hypothetical protein
MNDRDFLETEAVPLGRTFEAGYFMMVFRPFIVQNTGSPPLYNLTE